MNQTKLTQIWMKQKVLPQFKKTRIIIDYEARSKKSRRQSFKRSESRKSIFGVEPKIQLFIE